MRIHPRPLLLIFFCFFAGASQILAQGQCSFTINMVNNNRYAYDTAEECTNCWPFCHSVPFGNWGVSSNVGSKQNANQFEGWNPYCSNGSGAQVQWNSCSVDYVKPDLNCQRLNFPDYGGSFPYPANNYPFSDPFFYNDSVPPYGSSRCVDQYSPCGANAYGYATVSVWVPAQEDLDSDGIADAGGCSVLNGWWAGVQNNFMTVYELDSPDPDDVVESLYFPDAWTQLACNPYSCFPTNDSNYDGWVDDLNNQASPDYLWPTLYQDNDNIICYPTDPNVPCKRIDATVRVGRTVGYYSGPSPADCGQAAQDACANMGGDWDYNNCQCRCSTTGGSWVCELQ